MAGVHYWDTLWDTLWDTPEKPVSETLCFATVWVHKTVVLVVFSGFTVPISGFLCFPVITLPLANTPPGRLKPSGKSLIIE